VMSELGKLSQQELSVALGMLESEVALYIADSEPMADGAGHWIYFSQDANIPEALISRLGVGSDRRLPFYKSLSVWP